MGGREAIEHGGGIEGFNTHLAYYPEDKLSIVVLANLNGQAPDEIARKLAAVAHGEKVKAISDRKEIGLSPAMLARYVGTYEFTPKVNMKITPAGNQLMGQLSGQVNFLYSPSPIRFFFSRS